MNAKNLTARYVKPILKRAELSGIGLHDLRHTCATLVHTRGRTPEIRSGTPQPRDHLHNPRYTYSHVLPGMGNQTVVAMEQVLR
jgi:integrase